MKSINTLVLVVSLPIYHEGISNLEGDNNRVLVLISLHQNNVAAAFLQLAVAFLQLTVLFQHVTNNLSCVVHVSVLCHSVA